MTNGGKKKEGGLDDSDRGAAESVRAQGDPSPELAERAGGIRRIVIAVSKVPEDDDEFGDEDEDSQGVDNEIFVHVSCI